MKKKTASQIFGTVLPFPTIKSVTLEGGGSKIKSLNPHIVTPGDFDSPSDSGDSENALRVKIIVSLRDIMEASGLTAFFDEEKVLNVMKVAVLQSTDASKTAIYRDDPTALYSKVTPLFDKGLTDSFKYYFANAHKDKIKSTVIDGEVILEKPYTFNFELSNMQPQHLSYFCICTIDFDAFAEEFGLEPQEAAEAFSGALMTDIFESNHAVVIDGGPVSYTEDAYYLPNGQKWEGPVHNHKGQWMAGSEHTNEPHPNLTKKMLSSTLVKDFRDLSGTPFSKDAFYKTQSKLTNFLGSVYEEKLANEIVENTREAVLYDLITHSPPIGNFKNRLSMVGILLTLDYKKLTEQYTKLSNVIIKPKPKTVRLFRKNLQTSNPPVETATLTGVYELDGVDNERYLTWHFADTVTPGNYSYHVELELNIKEHIKYVDNAIDSLKLLIRALGDYYSVATSTFNKETNLALDKSVGSLSHTEDFDLTMNKKIPMYDSSLGKYRPQFKNNNAVDISLDIIKNELGSSLMQNIFSNFYPGAYKKNVLDSALDPTNGSPDGISGVQKIFVNVLQDFEKVYGRKTINTGYSQDHTQKSPSKARNYEKIVINLQSTLDLRDNIDFGYEYLPLPPSTAGAANYSRDQFEQELASRTTKYFADNQINFSMVSAIGSFGDVSDSLYKYVGTNKIYTGNIILNSFDLSTSDLNIKKQAQSLLSIIDYNVIGPESKYTKPGILNSLSPLGIMPQSVALKNPNFSEPPDADATEEEINNTTDPINYNGTTIKLGLDSPDSELFFSLIKNSDSKFSDMKDIRFYDIANTIPGNPGSPAENKDVYTSKANKLGPPSKQWGNIILGIKSRVAEDGFASPPGSAATAEKRLQRYLSKMPNQTKALILSSRNDHPGVAIKSIGPFKEAKESSSLIKNNDPRKTLGARFMRHWFNFDNVARIEYLSGFDTNSANPKWETLEEIPEADGAPLPKHILCRLVKYESKLYNIRRPKVLELPIYNEYFLIKL